MNPKHDEWFAMERGADLRREAASSHLLVGAGNSATDRRLRMFLRESTKTLLQTVLLVLRGFRPAARLEPPTTPTT